MDTPVLVVMAAGMGSRYGGLKQLDPVGPSGQTILEYSLFDARRAGFGKVVFIIRPELEEAFETAIGARVRAHMEVCYAYQSVTSLPASLSVPQGREKPLGTAHAVYCARDAVGNAPFAVINADDFYGADAFQKIFAFLSRTRDEGSIYRYCMVGYQVENTLTENGTVSRGVCSVDAQGYLSDIIERTAIWRDDAGRIWFEEDRVAGEIQPGTMVSMNLWGFTSSIFEALEQGLCAFFQQDIPKNPLKAEFYLPFAVDNLILSGRATATVLQTSARWFGITYQQDKPVVCERLQKMTQDGSYPAAF